MSNVKSEAAAFFQKESQQAKVDFNLLPNANSFSSVFKMHELDAKEAREIEELLMASADGLDRFEVARDIQRMKNLTAEVKSISKQGIILIGERIKRAREILSRYGDESKTFTSWLMQTFGSRRTAYNTLSYYEFYSALPTEGLKEKLKSLPLKAAYVLASRKGDLDDKIQIVADYSGEKPAQVIERIQTTFPLKKEDKRVSKEKRSLDLIEKEVKRLLRHSLSQEGQKRLIDMLESLCVTL